jgi:hypothetical protein
MNSYPIINFLVRFGKWVAIVLAVLPLLVGLYLAATGAGWLMLPGGIVVGAIVYVVVKSYVELVCLIADMLLPK